MKKILSIIKNFLVDQNKIDQILNEARMAEGKGNHEEACYSYAIALHLGGKKNDIENKIKQIWESYGPFKFETQLANMKREYCSSGYESCGEGYYVGVVELINKIITS